VLACGGMDGLIWIWNISISSTTSSSTSTTSTTSTTSSSSLSSSVLGVLTGHEGGV